MSAGGLQVLPGVAYGGARPRASRQRLTKEADRDGDGEINEEEFLRIMKKTSLY